MCRRIERHLTEARLSTGKTLATFDFESVPMVSKAQAMALAAGDVWLDAGANLLLFGPSGGDKSHLAAAIGLALVEAGWRILFVRTTDLVQRLQIAHRELTLEAAIARLDRYELLILGDIAYVSRDQAETSVLFELITASKCGYWSWDNLCLSARRRSSLNGGIVITGSERAEQP